MIIKNIANFITITRIISTFGMIYAPVLSVSFFIFYIYAGISDVLDGLVARKLKIVSALGSKLDSVSDLFFYTTMMIKIWPFLVEHLPTYIWICIWVILAMRIMIYLSVLIKKHQLVSNHTILNKATGLLMFVLPFLVNNKKVFVTYSNGVIIIAAVAVLYEIALLLKNRSKD